MGFLSVVLTELKIHLKDSGAGTVDSYRVSSVFEVGNEIGADPATGPAFDGDNLFAVDEIFLTFFRFHGLTF
jgi:hypothetical protein